ncbi:hypothetical protein GCM10023069_15460 [Shinella granuli]
MGVERIGQAARQDARAAEQGFDFLQFPAGCCLGCLCCDGHGSSPRHLSLDICHLSHAISSSGVMPEDFANQDDGLVHGSISFSRVPGLVKRLLTRPAFPVDFLLQAIPLIRPGG